ncbi:MAG: hypothetical protein V4662_20680 [Verrucomicrobiota bacterium]
MKLSKALKLKNQLAGDVTTLKDRLTSQNSRASKVPFDYDNLQVLSDLRAKLDDLVKVKTSIAAANVAQYARIFRLAELKGLVAMIKGLDVRHGLFKEGGSYMQAAFETEYIAQIKKADADQLIAELEAEIISLQDSLDEFNHTHSITE